MADSVREEVTSGRVVTCDLGTLGISSRSVMGPVQSVFNRFSH